MKRREAIAANLSTYSTGLPCKNGHLSERYTTSGACKVCLAESAAGVRRALGRGAITPERQAQLEGLATIRLRAVPEDAPSLLDTAAALTLARRPLLVAVDVVGARQGTKPAGGTLLYVVNLDPADVQMMRDMQNALLTARGPDIEAERRRIFGGLAAQVEGARNNGETEWRFT